MILIYNKHNQDISILRGPNFLGHVLRALLPLADGRPYATSLLLVWRLPSSLVEVGGLFSSCYFVQTGLLNLQGKHCTLCVCWNVQLTTLCSSSSFHLSSVQRTDFDIFETFDSRNVPVAKSLIRKWIGKKTGFSPFCSH